MTKKSRRVRRKGARPRLSDAQLMQPAAQQAAVVTKTPAMAPASPAKAAPVPQAAALDFSQEYHYVVSDLQRIGVLAAVILGALVILSFIL
jgi:hypothetical protein